MQRTAAPTCAPACPKCEFAGGTSGRPAAAGGGRWRCAGCGTVWREVGGTAGAILPAADMREADRHVPNPSRRERDMLAILRPDAAARARQQNGGARRGRQGGRLAVAGTAAAALLPGWLAAGAIGAFPHRAGDGSPAEAVFEISELRAHRLARAGLNAVRVEGRITNRSNRRQPLGAVDIVVTGAPGKPLRRWTHMPALAYLEAGYSIVFSSANGAISRPAGSVEIRFAGMSKKAGL